MSSNGNNVSQKRQTLRASLTRRWVEVQRPDVIKAIEAEVDAAHPRVPKSKKSAGPLPRTLAALK